MKTKSLENIRKIIDIVDYNYNYTGETIIVSKKEWHLAIKHIENLRKESNTEYMYSVECEAARQLSI